MLRILISFFNNNERNAIFIFPIFFSFCQTPFKFWNYSLKVSCEKFTMIKWRKSMLNTNLSICGLAASLSSYTWLFDTFRHLHILQHKLFNMPNFQHTQTLYNKHAHFSTSYTLTLFNTHFITNEHTFAKHFSKNTSAHFSIYTHFLNHSLTCTLFTTHTHTFYRKQMHTHTNMIV